MTKVSDWLLEIRAPFLTLPVALIFLGTSAAAAAGYFVLWRAILALVGLVAMHVSVNVFNEYSDYRTGIDFHTERTPFSGGSGMLTSGRIDPKRALWLAIFALAVGIVVGAVFVQVTGLWLLPVLILGCLSVVFYTDFLARHGLGEIFAGLGLGLLPVLGAFFVQAEYYSPAAWVAAVPAGILTFNLLLLNEFPDVAADQKGGRRNLLLVLGEDPAGKIYTLALAFMYIWIVGAVVAGVIPVYCLAGLATLLVAWKPMKWAWSRARAKENVIPALGANVVTNLLTQALLGVGFVVSIYF